MKSTYNLIIGYLLLVIAIILICGTIRLKETDRRYQALLDEANSAIRFIQHRGLIIQYNWWRENKRRNKKEGVCGL